MSFEKAYGFYNQGDQTSYQPEGSMGYGDLPWLTGRPVCVSTL